MGLSDNSTIHLVNGEFNSFVNAKSVRVGNRVFVDMNVSKVYFRDYSKDQQLMKIFTIVHEGEVSKLMLTENHIMLRVIGEDIVSEEETTTSSDKTKIPEMLKCDCVPAREMKIGDLVPRWCGNFGVITHIEHGIGRSIQLMTKSGLLMVEKNIITCYVEPYETIKRLSVPVRHLSDFSHILVKKPFYYIPKKIYKLVV